MVSVIIPNYCHARSVKQRIDSVLDLRPLKETDCPRHPRDSTVELSHIHFSYDGKNEVLKDISLQVRQGEVLGIIGPYQGAKPREVLMTRQQLIEMTMNNPESTEG